MYLPTTTLMFLALPLLAIALYLVYGWASEGELPPIVRSINLNTFTQAGTVVVTSILLNSGTLPPVMTAGMFLLALTLTVLVISQLAIWLHLRNATANYVDTVIGRLDVRSGVLDADTLKAIGHHMVEVDVFPSPVSGFKRQRRKTFENLLRFLTNFDSVLRDEKDPFVIPAAERRGLIVAYTLSGLASFALFVYTLTVWVNSLQVTP